MAILATIGTTLGTALPVLKTVGKTALNGGKKLFQTVLSGNNTLSSTPASLFANQLLGGMGGQTSTTPFVPNNSNVDFSQYDSLSPTTQKYLYGGQ